MIIKVFGIHALYILIEKRFSQFYESRNFRFVNNAKLLLGNITNCLLWRRTFNSNSQEKNYVITG